ncbi:vascular endothelial growth factor receptor 1 isoform X2 [Procambarus clarkii]|uniref:vascular endothelial growth factor receptor 1 isoform X2 n=1 Tax=Procambarus clarkii TaxID=6728 RepID=UPI0037429EEC
MKQCPITCSIGDRTPTLKEARSGGLVHDDIQGAAVMKIYCLPLLVLVWHVGGAWSSRPPRLNVSEEVAVTSEEIFSIRCEGTEPLYWNWTSQYLENGTEYLTITHEQHHGTDYPYVSTLTMKDLYSSDTGYFYCAYYDVEYYNITTERADRTYIYVYDGQKDLVDEGRMLKNIRITTAETLVLDCRTTLPNITVQLWKDSNEISSKFDWDPRIGFVQKNLAVHDSGLYSCSINNKDKMSFIVTIDPATVSLPKPAIEKEANQHFVQGRGFRLNCSLILDKVVAFHWKIPNPSTVHTVTNTDLTRNGNMYKISMLHVLNATTKDSGTYECEVTSSGSKSNQDSLYVHVQESIKSFINITSAPVIRLKEEEFLKWRSDVIAYPPDPQLIYRDWTGKEIKETDRISTEHHANSESWLKITNVTANDYGLYKLEGITSDRKSRAFVEVLIEIKSRPTAVIKGVPPFMKAGQTLNVSCQTTGFPLPTITWLFDTCPTGIHTCSGDSKAFKHEDFGNSTLQPGNIKIFNISYIAQQSGILFCNAENKQGSGNSSVRVSISDIGGNFVFLHVGQNITNDKPKPTRTIEVIVNDDFYVMCGASKFLYKKVQLLFNGASILSNGSQIMVNESHLSVWSYLRRDKVTQDLEGTFTCIAEPNEDKPLKKRDLKIIVLDEKPVTFTDEANLFENGKTVEIKEGSEYMLNCTVTGTPTPVISWFKENIPLVPGDSTFFDNKTAFLLDNHQRVLLRHVFDDYTGHYSCRAENRIYKRIGSVILTIPKAGLSTAAKVGLAFACIGIVFLGVVVIVLIKRVKKERKFRKSFRKNELYLFEKGNIGQLNPDCTADEQAELLPYDPEWEVTRENIKIGKQLGSGAFGRVVKAQVSGLDIDGQPTTTVAVKMCKSQADQSQVRALALELKIMLHLGKHLNIVNLMGANTAHIGKGELWILVEYCRFGNLLAFMHRHRKRFINQIDPVTGQIDYMKLAMDPFSPMSPSSHSTREGYRCAPITDQDGYLAPTASNFTLASPPQRKSVASPPQSPRSVSGSSFETCMLDGQPRQVVDNPMYCVGIQRSVSDCPEGESGTNSSSGGSQIPPLDSKLQTMVSGANSDNESVGYSRNELQITNTDMTTVQSLQLPFSPSPLSPTDSSLLGVDSQGNPYSYDIGHIPGVNSPFTTSILVCWAWQVAQGMDYLTRRKVLHGDLAARNLLLADDNVVKISDFGLSREMYKKDVYMKKGDDLMPIKWMSIEAIRDRIFSVQSDVWAYGVTMWELFSLGSTPYPGIEVNQDFLQLLERGYRMDRPKYANQEIYDVLLKCWEMEPMDRPNFAQTAESLGILMLPDLKGQYMTLNDPYLLMNEERFRRQTDYLNMLSTPDFDNLTKDDDDTLALSINLQNANNGSRENNYLNMKSPDLVGYSRVGTDKFPSSGVTNPHYLPMSSSRGSPSPTVDVFSPRPNEPNRFTFAHESCRLTKLPEEDEYTSQDADKVTNDKDTEISSLINKDTRNTSEDHVSNHYRQDSENKEDIVDMSKENEVTYINLPYYESN